MHKHESVVAATATVLDNHYHDMAATTSPRPSPPHLYLGHALLQLLQLNEAVAVHVNVSDRTVVRSVLCLMVAMMICRSARG